MSDQVRTVSGPFMDLRLFRAAVAYPEVEFKTVGGLFMNLRLFRAAIAITEVEVRAVSDPLPQSGDLCWKTISSLLQYSHRESCSFVIRLQEGYIRRRETPAVEVRGMLLQDDASRPSTIQRWRK